MLLHAVSEGVPVGSWLFPSMVPIVPAPFARPHLPHAKLWPTLLEAALRAA
jgi:hypothetical protein